MLRVFTSAFRRMATQAVDLPMPNDQLIWIDCEMTGLDYRKQTLVEVAVIITDGNLANLIEGPEIVIHQPDSVLDTMDAWPRQTFEKNGLLQRIKDSKISMAEAENQLLHFVEKYTKKGKVPLAGNTVYMDRIFLQQYMPRLTSHFHYRLVDVTTVKELARRWSPEEYAAAPTKRMTHRALDDIKESIEELKYYRSSIFKI